MDEYIKREDAIKAIENDLSEQVRYSREDAADCIRYMDAVEVVPVQEWISVDDRLPQEDGAYLVTTNSFGDRQSVKLRWFAKDGENVDAYDLAGQKDVWYLYDIECGYVSIKTVTHWMPLPSTEGLE